MQLLTDQSVSVYHPATNVHVLASTTIHKLKENKEEQGTAQVGPLLFQVFTAGQCSRKTFYILLLLFLL